MKITKKRVAATASLVVVVAGAVAGLAFPESVDAIRELIPEVQAAIKEAIFAYFDD